MILLLKVLNKQAKTKKDSSMKKNITKFLLLGSSILFTACGNSSSSETNNNISQDSNISQESTHFGVFLDSAVENLGYKTATYSGYTDANGTFKYKDGESISFSLGGVELGNAKAKRVLTPFEVTSTTDIDDPQLLKLLQLLQSVDADKNSSNGIVVPSDIQERASTMDIVLSKEANISDTLLQLGINSKDIVADITAKSHFKKTLKQRDRATGLVLHMPFTLNAQNISSYTINVEENNVTLDNFALNMKNNDINLSYISALEPRSITISFWAKISSTSDDTKEVLFALHDGKSNYIENSAYTMHKYEILKTIVKGEATLALSMSYQEEHSGNIDAQYYVQNRSNILESNVWHHFAYTYSPDVDTVSAYDSVEWDEATQTYVTVHHEGIKGAVRVFYDGKENMTFTHKTVVNGVDYYELRDMNATSSKSIYHTPTFSFGKFNGSIDDLRIYNRVLTFEEINKLSNI